MNSTNRRHFIRATLSASIAAAVLDLKILLCPEDETQMAVNKEMLFDFDNDEELNAMPAAVLAMAKDLSAAKAKAVKAKQFVQQRQREMVEELRKATYSPV